jgi:ABC-type polysaccharide/polyol phosphate export permease
MTWLQRLTELVKYRELVWNLVVRDLKVRYRNSILGFLWSLVNPLLMMTVFTVVFTVMWPNNQIPRFPVFVLCAILPWNWFTTSVMGAIPSIVGNAHLIKKVYFPREVLPLSVVLSNLVNFLLALLVLFAMLFVFGINLSRWALLLPVIILIQLAFTLGLAFILSTLNVFYRDTGVIMEVLLLAWFFLTPIFYPIDLLPQHRLLWGFDLDIRRLAYILNPMASLISAYRDILWGSLAGGPPGPPALDFLTRTCLTALAVLAAGYLFFNRRSRVFGEEV